MKLKELSVDEKVGVTCWTVPDKRPEIEIEVMVVILNCSGRITFTRQLAFKGSKEENWIFMLLVSYTIPKTDALVLPSTVMEALVRVAPVETLTVESHMSMLPSPAS